MIIYIILFIILLLSAFLDNFIVFLSPLYYLNNDNFIIQRIKF
jgi:hypothetical protein